MAQNDNDFVDITSSSERARAYQNAAYQGGSRHPSTAPKKRKKGLGLRITALILSIIMLLVGSGMIFVFLMLDVINYDNLLDDKNKAVEATLPTDGNTDPTINAGSSSLLSSSSVLNILLFGQDNRQGENDNGRSDTTILMSIDTLHEKIKLTSFQRDTYVSIPGYQDNKINAAYSWGGVKLSIATIEANFGIKVDKYAVVDFASFRKIIDALNGIDIELNLEEIQYINAQIDVNNQLGKTQFLEYDPNKEKQVVHLDGYQALWYARDRGEENLGGNPEYSFSGDDWDRTSRQRNLVRTIINELKSEGNIVSIVKIINEIGPLITTNLKKSDITFLVSNMMTYMDYEMVEMSLPTEGNWQYGHTEDGQSVIVITDWDQVRLDLANFIYEDAVQTK